MLNFVRHSLDKIQIIRYNYFWLFYFYYICGCGEIDRHVRFRLRYFIAFIKLSPVGSQIRQQNLICECGKIGRHDRFRLRYFITFIKLSTVGSQVRQQNLICGYGEIGIRTRFRFWRSNPCRFNSCYPHQKVLAVGSSPTALIISH